MLIVSLVSATFPQMPTPKGMVMDSALARLIASSKPAITITINLYSAAVLSLFPWNSVELQNTPNKSAVLGSLMSCSAYITAAAVSKMELHRHRVVVKSAEN